MSENTPTSPGGPVPPPKPAEAAKVQPKKETVRISLPPKPSAAPTIRMPSSPAGGPPVSAPVAAPGVAAAPVAPVAARPPTGGATASPGSTTGPAVARPPTSTGIPSPRPAGAGPPIPRAAAAPAARRVSGLDTGLAIAAAIVGLLAIGSIVLLFG